MVVCCKTKNYNRSLFTQGDLPVQKTILFIEVRYLITDVIYLTRYFSVPSELVFQSILFINNQSQAARKKLKLAAPIFVVLSTYFN